MVERPSKIKEGQLTPVDHDGIYKSIILP